MGSRVEGNKEVKKALLVTFMVNRVYIYSNEKEKEREISSQNLDIF